MRTPLAVLSALLFIGMLSGCAGLRSAGNLPPISQEVSEERHIGKFVWFDLLTEQADAARPFYGSLFGWTFDDSSTPPDYSLIRLDGLPIGGIVNIRDKLSQSESQWLGYLSVTSVDRTTRVSRDLGGEVIDGPVEVLGRGRMAVVRDPTGAAFVALTSATGDPPDAVPPIGAWLWTDLITNDGATAEAFYNEIVGYKVQEIRTGDGDIYQVVGRDSRARAGIVEVNWTDVDSNWLPYVRVSDVSATIQQAEALGGRLLLRIDDAAMLMDPTGAVVGVQRYGKERK
jgi:predicted enzyme related to lactoylglutathione lyase